MNLHDQLKSLFPEHDFKEETNKSEPVLFQKEPLLCKYEKRKGKPVTIIDGFRSVNDSEKKELAKKLKTMFSVGGSVKNGKIIIQGDNRSLIMNELKRIGFKVKRVGG
ncbi:MAG: translation initiation factor SUI1-related protein [Flavobacteriaceae bacterium]|mgnify:CR=1 FL=1|nr:translation initiation factor SUI1-related protein [Flavobacteriaceae bacterium]|tara:strand:- start:5839 stop:6162 length:324 start_codon:yes stop_codon:yes gene_type:complete